MKRALIIILFIIFSSSFSSANSNEKITLEDIRNVLEYEGVASWNKGTVKNDNESWNDYYVRIKREFQKKQELRNNIIAIQEKDILLYIKQRSIPFEQERKNAIIKKLYSKTNKTELEILELKRLQTTNLQKQNKLDFEISILTNKTPRFQNRGIARCMYNFGAYGGEDKSKSCRAKVIRSVFTYSEKSKKRRPGDIFYSVDAIKDIVGTSDESYKFTEEIDYNEAVRSIVGKSSYPLIACVGWNTHKIKCRTFKKSTYKKIEKFIKDPSNEKVLGHKFIRYIKNLRMIKNFHEKLGTNNYKILGDMMNAAVTDVKENKVSPELAKRRALLKKYSLNLQKIKKKLNEDNYKSIDKDISKLSKSYEDLTSLTSNTNEALVNIDGAINTLFGTNKLIQNTTLNAKDNVEEKLLAQSAITFIEFLIDSILSTIPEKYYAETQELPQDFFGEFELAELENIIDSMKNKNKEIKSAELNKSMDAIKKHINTSNVLKTLNNLGIKNNIDEEITLNKATKIAMKQIRDNLDRDILKSVSKLVDNMDKNELSELTKEVSNITSEIASSPSVKDTVSVSAVDREYGGQNLKKLIGAGRCC
ncbi:hypothetical protein OAO20_00245 [Candidatus Pelagibacter ubique]|nr:hypothetical protein [Candidatus Pelagibacter ubique]